MVSAQRQKRRIYEWHTWRTNKRRARPSDRPVSVGQTKLCLHNVPHDENFQKLQNLISCLSEQQYSQIPLPDEVKSGLLTWWAFLETNNTGLPIVRDVSSPPLCHKLLTTDVSGWKKDDSSPTKVGMGCAGLDEEGEIFFTSQHFWESDNSKTFLDSESKFLGC